MYLVFKKFVDLLAFWGQKYYFIQQCQLSFVSGNG